MDYRLYWTDLALENLDEIINYLEHKWTEKEVNTFKEKLGKHLSLIEKNPLLFPVFGHTRDIRKSV